MIKQPITCPRRDGAGKRKARVASVVRAPIDWAKRYHAVRGLYRVFNAAVYRFYRSNSGPPLESDTPFATNASLPHEPADVYADGTWYLSVSYFNGVIDSGFLPLGPAGETYLKLKIAAGAEVNAPPNRTNGWHLEQRAGGIIAVVGFYHQGDALRAEEFAIAYTVFDTGTPPPEPGQDAPDYTVAMEDSGLAILDYELPAQAAGKSVNVLLQTRRNDGTVGSPSWVYSDYNSTYDLDNIAVDATGPSVPKDIEVWPGILPEGL